MVYTKTDAVFCLGELPVRCFRSVSLALIMLLLSASWSLGAYTVNIDTARDLMAKGQYEDAIPLLEEAVADSPDSAEGHFLLGVANLWTRDCDAACEAFSRALEQDPGLVGQMADQIKKRVIERVLAGDVEEAKSAISVAVKQDPELRKEITRSCIYRGEDYLESGENVLAEDLFRFAADIDPQTKARICELLYTKARAVTGEESLKLVLQSLRYGDRYQDETLAMVFRLANDLDDEAKRMRYLEQTSNFARPQSILQATVEYYTRKYGPPGKVNLFSPDIWVGMDKTRNDARVRYLTGDKVITRGSSGPQDLERSVYMAMDFPGTATPTAKGYQQKMWFLTTQEQAVVYYWIVPDH